MTGDLTEWNDLLRVLAEQPRENGTPALRAAAEFLVERLHSAGLDAHLVSFTAQPYRLRLAGVIAFAGALLYTWCLRIRHPGLALLVAIATPVVLLADLDYHVPLFGWIGSGAAAHVELRLPAAQPMRRLLLTAHYDTKTDWLDHVERAPIELLGLPVTLLMIAGALLAWRAQRRIGLHAPRPRTARVAGIVAVLYGAGMLASLSAGALVSNRSPGALDNGAACAVLVRLAERLAANPLAHTDVDLVWLAAEEAGVQGSHAYAAARFATPPDLPTSVINLEFIGASPNFAVFGRETFSLRSYPPDPALVRTLDQIHQQQRGTPLHITWYGAATDARSFLAHGIPAATLSSDLPEHALPRHLHSAADNTSRLTSTALDAALDYLTATARHIDTAGL